MNARRGVFQVAVILTAFLVQVTVLDQWNLPVGRPDLVLVCVIGFALSGGPARGAAIGFAAGLAVDLLPPSDHLAGQLAIAYTIVGYAVGMLDYLEETSVFTTILIVAAGSAAAVIGYSAVGALVGDARISGRAAAHALIAAVVYDVVLAPFVVPLISGAIRRLEPASPR